MKKILALVLCLMLALSMTAFAETPVTSMNITLSEIELNVGEAYALNPAVSFSFGVDGEAFWAEVAAQLEGANVLALQIEGMSDDTAYVSVDGANDVLKVANVSELANTQGFDLVGTIESLKESFMLPLHGRHFRRPGGHAHLPQGAHPHGACACDRGAAGQPRFDG